MVDFQCPVSFSRHPLTESHSLVFEEMRPFSVDGELELLAGNVAADAEVLDRELVVAIGREVMPHQHPASGAERQPFEMLILRGIARRKVGRFGRRLPVADRHARHSRGGRRVGFQQCRRDGQGTGDVVEASCRIIRRQKRRDIDLEIEQVADGVGVFGSIEPMEDDGAWIDAGGGLAIDVRFQEVAQRLVVGQWRALHVRRRHDAGP